VWRRDACSAQIGGPDGISQAFQVSAYSGEPFTSSAVRNLLSKDCCRAALGDEAVLVCPAPEVSAEEGIDIVVAARFPEELDEETVYWRQLQLMEEIHNVLRVEAVVVDLDTPLEFLKYIEPMLAAPYRNELGSRGTAVQGG
jgi:hypothetical protein